MGEVSSDQVTASGGRSSVRPLPGPASPPCAGADTDCGEPSGEDADPADWDSRDTGCCSGACTAAEAGANAGIRSGLSSDLGTDTRSGSDADLDASIDVEPDTDAGLDTGTDEGANLDADVDVDKEFDETIGAGTDLDANFGTDVETVTTSGAITDPETSLKSVFVAIEETSCDADGAVGVGVCVVTDTALEAATLVGAGWLFVVGGAPGCQGAGAAAAAVASVRAQRAHHTVIVIVTVLLVRERQSIQLVRGQPIGQLEIL